MKLLIQHNQEIAQLSPDPFPLLRAGSGDETTPRWAISRSYDSIAMSRTTVTLDDLIGLPDFKTADSAQLRNRSTVTRPFSSLERAGSGDETNVGMTPRVKSHVICT